MPMPWTGERSRVNARSSTGGSIVLLPPVVYSSGFLSALVGRRRRRRRRRRRPRRRRRRRCEMNSYTLEDTPRGANDRAKHYGNNFL